VDKRIREKPVHYTGRNKNEQEAKELYTRIQARGVAAVGKQREKCTRDRG
jgi:hypothetical protein